MNSHRLGRVASVLFALVWLVFFAARPAFADGIRKADDRVVFRTTLGDLVFALYPDVAPRTVEQFLRLVRAGVYDGTHFYRIEPTFVIQLATAQDRRTPLLVAQQALIHPLPGEFGGALHVPGVLSMAHADGLPDSGETSFSILLVPAPHLDGKYTIFGEIERGDDVVRAIASVERDSANRPTEPIEVIQAVVASPTEFATLTLRGAIAPTRTAAAATVRTANDLGEGHGAGTSMFVVVCLMALLGIATFAVAGKVSPRLVASLGLLQALAGFFLCFAIWVPVTNVQGGWGAVAMLLATVGTFRLLGKFESVGPGR
jgi:cyclophilin family peptidyl-prolyl cis-trans isomerase